MTALGLAALPQKLTAGLVLLVLVMVAGLPARDEIREQQWHLAFLNIEQAHAISTGEGVVVGLIDSGVDGEHPDLAGSVRRGADFTFLERPDAWEDLDGHGTAMAGLIVAHGRALGIAPDATILPVRSRTDDVGVGSASAAAIDWAVDRGATVLCLAFGSPEPNIQLENAINRAIERDVVVVAAAGNTPGQGIEYPAAYPGVVGAAGVDADGNHADISIVSPAAVLAAPAVEVGSTGPRNLEPDGYLLTGGTSAATAIIAGVAALIRSEYPQLSAADVVNRMIVTADDRGAPGRDDEYGYGIVNPVAALTADVPLLESSATPTGEPSGTRSEAAEPGKAAPVALAVVAGVAVAVLLIVGLVLARGRRS